MLVLIFLLVWATLGVLFWAGTAWMQGYIYSEPAEQLYWRAPAAGTLLTLWLAYWAFLDVRNPEKYDALFRFSNTEFQEFDELWVERDHKKVRYKKSTVLQGTRKGRSEYRETEPPHRLWSRSEAIILSENGQEVRFEADRDKNKNYKVEPGKSLLYRDARGRSISEDFPGTVVVRRGGLFLANLTLNVIHGILWFLSLWLLLRFQWAHALGLAAICWTIMTVLILPMLLTRASEEGRKRKEPVRAAFWLGERRDVSTRTRRADAAPFAIARYQTSSRKVYG